MQTLNLIIPMAGKGKRFVDKSYTKYKTLLEVDKYNTVYDKLVSNFNHKSIRIILILNNETYIVSLCLGLLFQQSIWPRTSTSILVRGQTL